MADPTKRPWTTTTLTWKDGQPCYALIQDGIVTTCWRLSDEEVAAVINSRRVVVQVLGNTQPPMAVSADTADVSDGAVGLEVFPPALMAELMRIGNAAMAAGPVDFHAMQWRKDALEKRIAIDTKEAAVIARALMICRENLKHAEE